MSAAVTPPAPAPVPGPVLRRVLVRGSSVAYLDGGAATAATPVVLLHGWGLGPVSYRGPVRALLHGGVRVVAPAMPGFGGSAELPAAELTLAGYARWVIDFLDAAGIVEPVALVGHSFGGGVAIRVAHDAPGRVARLVLVNSIGGSVWSDDPVPRALSERPLWDWGLHLRADLGPWRRVTRVLPVVLQDALGNALRNPVAVWRVAELARTADLRPEMAELARRRLPVVILWGMRDEVLPQASLVALRLALAGAELRTVEGSHGWLLSDPAGFGEVMTNVLGEAALPAVDDAAAGLA